MILTPLIPLPFSEEGHQGGRDRWVHGTWMCGGPGPGRKGLGQEPMLYACPDLMLAGGLQGVRVSGLARGWPCQVGVGPGAGMWTHLQRPPEPEPRGAPFLVGVSLNL